MAFVVFVALEVFVAIVGFSWFMGFFALGKTRLRRSRTHACGVPGALAPRGPRGPPAAEKLRYVLGEVAEVGRASRPVQARGRGHLQLRAPGSSSNHPRQLTPVRRRSPGPPPAGGRPAMTRGAGGGRGHVMPGSCNPRDSLGPRAQRAPASKVWVLGSAREPSVRKLRREDGQVPGQLGDLGGAPSRTKRAQRERAGFNTSTAKTSKWGVRPVA